MSELSRREFVALATASAASVALGRPAVGAGAITVGELLERLKARLGVEWKPDGPDGLKAGDPAAPVTGIATTALATLGVLRRAAAAGANVVVTAQPAFYARTDARTPPAGRGGGPPAVDPVYAGKNAFVDERRLAIIRLGEPWRQQDGSPLVRGLAAALGWAEPEAAGDSARYAIPPVDLEALAAHVGRSLEVRGGLRVVGDRRARIRRVGLLPGSTPLQAAVRLLPEVDALVAGEVREWETVEYVRDAAFAGEGKGLVLVGRVVSEEPGMKRCAEWIASAVPEAPLVRHLPAGDPYWRPAP